MRRYKEHNFKIELKDYLIKKHNSFHLNKDNLPPEIEISKKRENLKGQEINKIKILYPCGYNADRRVVYVCKCFCGTFFIASHKNLKSGVTKSCDCLRNSRVIETNISRTDNIEGKIFGKLKVLSFYGYKKCYDGRQAALYECECSCGRKCIKRGAYLRCGDTRSCGLCGMNSAGEAEIANILDEEQIEYIPQYSFEDCLSEKGYPLYFGFALFKNDNLICLIEYDGEQHYKNKESFNNFFGNFEIRHNRDLTKDAYCRNANAPLYRIRFDEKIQTRLEEILNELFR